MEHRVNEDFFKSYTDTLQENPKFVIKANNFKAIINYLLNNQINVGDIEKYIINNKPEPPPTIADFASDIYNDSKYIDKKRNSIKDFYENTVKTDIIKYETALSAYNKDKTQANYNNLEALYKTAQADIAALAQKNNYFFQVQANLDYLKARYGITQDQISDITAYLTSTLENTNAAPMPSPTSEIAANDIYNDSKYVDENENSIKDFYKNTVKKDMDNYNSALSAYNNDKSPDNYNNLKTAYDNLTLDIVLLQDKNDVFFSDSVKLAYLKTQYGITSDQIADIRSYLTSNLENINIPNMIPITYPTPTTLDELKQDLDDWKKFSAIFWGQINTIEGWMNSDPNMNIDTLRSLVLLKLKKDLLLPDVYKTEGLTQSILYEFLVTVLGLDKSFVPPEVIDAPPNKVDEVPVTIKIPPGKNPDDIYIRIQGTDPNTGQYCCVTFDVNGNPVYHDLGMSPAGSTDASQYDMQLSSLPHARNGQDILIYVPYLHSGQMFISDGELKWLDPSMTNPSDPDINIKFGTVEFDQQQNKYPDYNVTGVSWSGLPLKLWMQSTTGTQMTGFDGNMQTFYNNVLALLNKYDPTGTWAKLAQKAGVDILRFLAPKMSPETFKTQLDGYLNNTFIPYFMNHYFWIKTDDGAIYFGIIKKTSAGQYYFQFKETEPAASSIFNINFPADQNEAAGWLSGGAGEWGTEDPVSLQIIKQIVSAFNMGLRPEDMNLTSTNPLCKDYFQNMDNIKNFYKAAFYNIYDRAMHEAQWNGYAYDYDDVIGQDGSISADWDTNPSVTISLGDWG